MRQKALSLLTATLAAGLVFLAIIVPNMITGIIGNEAHAIFKSANLFPGIREFLSEKVNISAWILLSVVPIVLGILSWLILRHYFVHRRINKARNIVCKNQGHLTNYYIVSNQKHKFLRDQLLIVESLKSRGYFPGRQEQVEREFDKLEQIYEDLRNYLNDAFRFIARMNFEQLKSLYKYRLLNQRLPRICIKAVSDNKIRTLVRDNQAYYFEMASTPVSSNTAFEQIRMSNGKYFICNNIPAAIKQRKYRNPRINISYVNESYNSIPYQELYYSLFKAVDEKWVACWDKVELPSRVYRPPAPESCYKSTLIIPMTFIASDGSMDGDVKRRFNVGYDGTKIGLGFLCLDHQNINFFNQDEDVDFGYIIADLLSLYLIQRLNCTDYSSTFREAGKVLREHEA